MFHIVLFEPEIPPNTGNIIRLSVNVGASLHLIHPLGFDLSERQLRRAGMDYRDVAHVREHGSWDEFKDSCQPSRIFALSTKGACCYTDARFEPNDALLFGPESRGLPAEVLTSVSEEFRLFVPMAHRASRSLNLSNAVAVVVYEAWRQNQFEVR
jgi:tRNA (cytidine/uridine-2'-O-)-methyltransferase